MTVQMETLLSEWSAEL
jgi:hypothetical protein